MMDKDGKDLSAKSAMSLVIKILKSLIQKAGFCPYYSLQDLIDIIVSHLEKEKIIILPAETIQKEVGVIIFNLMLVKPPEVGEILSEVKLGIINDKKPPQFKITIFG